MCRQPMMHEFACCRYCLIVLRANDNGQGGAFALFSLLKRQAELGKKSKVRAVQLHGHIDSGLLPKASAQLLVCAGAQCQYTAALDWIYYPSLGPFCNFISVQSTLLCI